MPENCNQNEGEPMRIRKENLISFLGIIPTSEELTLTIYYNESMGRLEITLYDGFNVVTRTENVDIMTINNTLLESNTIFEIEG